MLRFRKLSTNAIYIPILAVLALATAYLQQASAQEEPAYGGTMVVALGANPAHLNSAISSSVVITVPGNVILQSLIRLDSEFNVQPVLAESWEVSEDGRIYRFHLREDVEWHDGERFDAADVVYTFREITPLHPRAEPIFANVESVEPEGDFEVVVTLKEPFGPFLSFLNPSNVPIVAEHIYAGSDPSDNPANLAPIGTGPFKFESWQSGQSITLARNPEYWEPERPYLDRLVFSIIPDPSARILALESGQVDLLVSYDLDFNDIPRLQQNPEITVLQRTGTPIQMLLIFNTKDSPLSVPEVRKALFQGSDRQMILDSSFGGDGTLGTSAIPPRITWAYNPDVDYEAMYPFDTDEANRVLDEAGFPRGNDGRRFSIRFTYDPGQGGFTEVAEILRANWADLGVDLVLRPRERNVWIDDVYIRKDFDTTIALYGAGIDPAFGVDRAYRCVDIRPAAFTNGSQYCNEQLDVLLDGARATASQEERAEFYKRAQEIIAEDLPTTVLVELPHAQVASSRIGNLDAVFDFSHEAVARWAQAYIKQR